MDITVNGKPINVDQGTTVSQYLETLGFSERNSIAVALNKEIIQQYCYTRHLEILSTEEIRVTETLSHFYLYFL